MRRTLAAAALVAATFMTLFVSSAPASAGGVQGYYATMKQCKAVKTVFQVAFPFRDYYCALNATPKGAYQLRWN